VIPARNEAENLAILVREIDEALGNRAHEIIVVDDGSTDQTGQTLIQLKADGINVRHLRHDRSCGQSRAVRTGMLAAKGDLVVTIDGDGQNDPAFIPLLVETLEAAEPNVGLVAGQRVGRQDTELKKFSSRFANGIRTAILKDRTRDTGCGLKAIPTDLFRTLPFFDGWHRYFPALVLREGYEIAHVDVRDRERRFGTSNYGVIDRGLRGILDLYGVWWLIRRARKVPVVTEINPEERT
jgi:glycosyltransferase involved in cell wall biosynthesis